MGDKQRHGHGAGGGGFPLSSGTAAEWHADGGSYLPPSLPGARPAFLVLPEGRNERPSLREPGNSVSGPCLIRSEDWLNRAGGLYDTWLKSADGEEASAALRRIGYRLRDEAFALDSPWTAVSLPKTTELAARPDRLAELQDVILEALFRALGDRQRAGGDCRLDLLAPYPASGWEFAAAREFIESVAEQLLGHRYAAACRIGALIAPDTPPAAAAEIGRTADFLVIDGAAAEAAPAGPAAGFVSAAEGILAAVRGVKPAAVVFAAGAPAAEELADLYRIGLNGIFCGPAERTEALLRAACLVWMDRHDSGSTSASAQG